MSKVVNFINQNLDAFCVDLLLKSAKVGKENYNISDYRVCIDYGTMEDGKVANELIIYRKGERKPLAVFYVDFGQRQCSSIYKTKDRYIRSLDMMLGYYLESFDWIDPRYFLGISEEELAV